MRLLAPFCLRWIMSEYDGSILINTSIITKNIAPKVQEIEKHLQEIGIEADKAQAKLEDLDKAGVSHSSVEYKKAKEELRSYVDSYKDAAYQLSDYARQVEDSLTFDSSQIDEARKKLSLLELSGTSNSDKKYKEAERNLNHLINAQQRYQSTLAEFEGPETKAWNELERLLSKTDQYFKQQEKSVLQFDGHINTLKLV